MEDVMPAGFWLAWECGLARKREVLLIARALAVSHREAAAMCMEVWEWAEGQTPDGIIEGLTVADVSGAVGIERIGEAMAAAGWLTDHGGGVTFPKWKRFNSKCAKARMLAAERKRQQRDRCHGRSVT